MNAVRELAFDLENYSSQIEIDESAFFEIENRLNQIQTLKRKYGSTIEDIFKTREEASEKLNKLDNFEYLMEELKNRKEKAFLDYMHAARKLSDKRKKTAEILNRKITSTLRSLGFEKAEFYVGFSETQPSGNGIDSIEFMFSANPGESVNPLKAVASSGEISRVMLALKTVIADADSIPVLVFDEIDVNIGGETAAVVGQKLKDLSKSHQLLCISHLPMVAACADRHYKVQKSVTDERTISKIELLDQKGRLGEITRMLGGGSAAEKHAEKLLA
jgi:DNA repair protein RecN (Recombination protein N)